MPTLNAMNIFIFIFIFHLVANQEKLFLKLKDSEEIKLEFTLNNNTNGGKLLYNILKENKTYVLEMQYDNNNGYFKGNIQNIGPSIVGAFVSAINYEKGEIIGITPNEFCIIKSLLSINKKYTRIGKITQPEKMDTIFGSDPITLEFLLVEEENETPKENKKSGGWKTVKILKIIKALKRYRIVKRMKKLKSLKN